MPNRLWESYAAWILMSRTPCAKTTASDAVEAVAQGRRIPTKVIDPAAAESERRILEWRARGGKVACLFGRVVCDSAVPFDGGPVHSDLRDWLRHSIEAVRGSNTLLLIK